MALQGRSWQSNIKLLSGGSPVTGVVVGDVTVWYLPAGASSLQPKTLAAEDWTEIGNGLYTLAWSESEMGSIGPFYATVDASGADLVTVEFDVVPNQIGGLITPDTCIITGNITDLGGDPSQRSAVVFRLAKRPSEVGGAFVSAVPQQTLPDVFGAFSVVLVRGVRTIVEIPSVGIRHTIDVPDQDTANLVDLLPPIENLP